MDKFDSLQVEDFFRRTEYSTKSTGSINADEWRRPDVIDLLDDFNRRLADRFEGFAESIASDERINEFLPRIGSYALCDVTKPDSKGFNAVDTDKNESLSVAELEAAAQNEDRFDPVNRAAFRFLLKNYDRVREFNLKDKSTEISFADVRTMGYACNKIARIPARQRATKLLSGWFDNIDSNHNGSIIEKEARGTSDRALISGILWKRLDQGIALQVDAPFLYILG
ncbi:MAG: hypothetical protein K2X97_01390, partial [Mycobacteriaceae bacterium]|nr:hypothetical protein [Mycobacteriaceae bacterium]